MARFLHMNRQAKAMTVRLTDEEIELIQDALQTYTKVLNEKARPHCAGYSAAGIALCCRRMSVETLAAQLANRRSEGVAIQVPPGTAADLESLPERAA